MEKSVIRPIHDQLKIRIFCKSSQRRDLEKKLKKKKQQEQQHQQKTKQQQKQ